MFTCALQSGSNGNCIYVETENVRLLFDAGISAKVAQERLAQRGRDIRQVDALIISHNHSDHISSAGVFQRRFGLTLHMTGRVLKASQSRLGQVLDVKQFKPGETLAFGETAVETVPTAHDGVDGVAFVVTHKRKKLGIFTDLGHRFNGIEQRLQDLDALYLESNYDPQMLSQGPYPVWLKRRIIGQGGHLSNSEAAQLVEDCSAGLQLLVLSHLSQHNNSPELALQTARAVLTRPLKLAFASRNTITEMFAV